MNKELISIIVPIYNVRNYLSECIESILAQTYSAIEVILIDDGSTDGSDKVCDQYATKDRRIHVIHQKNQGLSTARNTGLDICQGNYISFIDSDDYICPTMIQTLKDNLEKQHADVAMVSTKIIRPNGLEEIINIDDADESGLVIADGRYMSSILLKYYDRWRMGAVWNKLFTRDIIGEERFIITAAEDMEFNNRIFLKTRKAVIINQALYVWRRHENAISRLLSFEIHQKETRLLCLKELPKDDYKLRAECLVVLYKDLPRIRYWYSKTPLREKALETIHKIYDETIKEFHQNPSIPILQKWQGILLMHIPILYNIYIRLKKQKLVSRTT